MAIDPLIAGAWLKPGCHLDLIGSFTPHMREADQEAMRRASEFGDSRSRINGALSQPDILGDLYELAASTCPGWRNEEEIKLHDLDSRNECAL
jgi:alanine dehydrogenase